jgi:hypothetical protein
VWEVNWCVRARICKPPVPLTILRHLRLKTSGTLG